MTDPIQDPRIHSFGVALEAMGRITRTLEQTLKEEVDLSLSEFEALLRVARSGGHMPMGELASQLTLTTGGITRLVDRLTNLGLMERVPCDHDRRIQWATITEAGTARLHDALVHHLEDLSNEYVDRMSPSELMVVTEVMDRLRAAG